MITRVISKTSTDTVRRWDSTDRHVRAARRFVVSHAEIEPKELVEWDRTHGKKLFEWDDAKAGREYRLHQARQFINRIAWVVDNAIGKVRVKALYNVPTGASGVDEDEPARIYRSARDVAANPKDRAAVIEFLTRRMETLAADLRFFKLTKAEQRELLARIERVIAAE